MDRQGFRGGGASAGAVQEICYVGSRQPEVAGGALVLMELLEDTPTHYADEATPEAVDARLRRVMRALETELSGGAAPVPGPEDREQSTAMADGPMSDDDDGGLEDMLSEFDGGLATEAPSLAAAVVPFEYWDEALPLMGDDGMGMGGWYVDGEGFVAGYELREGCYYTYGESSGIEQVYSPLCLWE